MTELSKNNLIEIRDFGSNAKDRVLLEQNNKMLAQLLLHLKAYPGGEDEPEMKTEGKCKYCGFKGRWGETKTHGFRIYDAKGSIHECPKRPGAPKRNNRSGGEISGKYEQNYKNGKPIQGDFDDDIPF